MYKQTAKFCLNTTSIGKYINKRMILVYDKYKHLFFGKKKYITRITKMERGEKYALLEKNNR